MYSTNIHGQTVLAQWPQMGWLYIENIVNEISSFLEEEQKYLKGNLGKT